MELQTSEQYTQIISKYLNTFINDVYKNKEKVLTKVDEFPAEHHLLIKKAIKEGPDCLPKDDPKICKTMFNFIVFYATGTIPTVDVEVKNDRQAV